MRTARIAGLIVAAGYSSRMGAFKPLLPLGEKTVIETAVASLRLGGVTDVRVVVGYRGAELYPILDDLKVSIINNPNYADGMFSSIVTGVKAFAEEVDAFFLLPADIPLIRKHTVKELVRACRKTGAAVVYPVFNGQRGHPPLISAKCFDRILTTAGTGGLRPILEQFAADSVEVEVADKGILLDMDNRQDYEQLVEFQTQRHIPTYDEGISLFRKHHVTDNVARDGQAVAQIGRYFAELLNAAGLKLNIDLVIAGGLLHDLAKGKPNHPQRGERMLKSNGFSALAGIVASHMDLEFRAGQVIDERAVVFLADKLVRGDRVVSLSERFIPAQERFADNPEILDSVLRRKQTAEAIGHQIAAVLGINSLETRVAGGDIYEAQLFQ